MKRMTRAHIRHELERMNIVASWYHNDTHSVLDRYLPKLGRGYATKAEVDAYFAARSWTAITQAIGQLASTERPLVRVHCENTLLPQE